MSFPAGFLLKIIVWVLLNLPIPIDLLLLVLSRVVVLGFVVVVDLAVVVGIDVEMHVCRLLLLVPRGCGNEELNIHLLILTVILSHINLLVLLLVSSAIVLVGVALHEAAGVDFFLFLLLLLAWVLHFLSTPSKVVFLSLAGLVNTGFYFG